MTQTFLLHRPINAANRAADSQLDCFSYEKRDNDGAQNFRCH